MTNATTRNRPGAALLLGLAFMCLACTAWMRPLMLPDEGRYVGVAYEMLRSGDWLTPTLNGLPFFHKPPLFYWLTAGSLAVFGNHELPARAAPLLGGFIAMGSLFLFARRWCGEPTARWALFALLAQPLLLLGGQFANLDMLVAGLISATVLLLADTVLRLESGSPHRRPLLGAWLAAALGVLAKGLIGIVIPGMIAVLALLWLRRPRFILRLLSPRGLAIFLLVAAPWFFTMEHLHPGFWQYFFVEQHLKRYAAGGFNNVQPFWFYPAIIALVCLPGWPWVWRGARTPSPGFERRWVRVFASVWALATVGFFSLPASKLLGYVLPAVPALALLAADGFAHRTAAVAPHGRWAVRSWWAGHALLTLLSLALVVYLAMHPLHSTRHLATWLVPALKAHRQPGEPIVMLERYAYDLPFYAQLQEPVIVLNDWADPGIAHGDDWRKEIADAAKFAPQLAHALLRSPSALEQIVCHHAATWVVAQASMQARYPQLLQAGVAASWKLAPPTPWHESQASALSEGDMRLWRIPGQAGGANGSACPQTPSSGSPQK